jgi:hypothetical protein
MVAPQAMIARDEGLYAAEIFKQRQRLRKFLQIRAGSIADEYYRVAARVARMSGQPFHSGLRTFDVVMQIACYEYFCHSMNMASP